MHAVGISTMLESGGNFMHSSSAAVWIYEFSVSSTLPRKDSVATESVPLDQ